MKYIVVFPGCFNPITYAHMMTADGVRSNIMESAPNCDECLILFSPTSDSYGVAKKGLVASKERVSMAKTAVSGISYMDVDEWESEQTSYVRTLLLLEHIQEKYPKDKIVLACGGDMAMTMTGSAWNAADVKEIVKNFAVVVVPRPNSHGVMDDERNITEAFRKCDYIKDYMDNISFAKDLPICSVSSTLVRERVKKGMGTVGLIPESVRVYIDKRKMYLEE